MTPIGLKWAETVPDHVKPAILQALGQFPTNTLETYRTHRRSTVGRMNIDGHSFVIKRYNSPNPSTLLRRVVGPSPASKAWKNASILRRLGIATPPIVCIVKVGLEGRLRPGAYLVTEYVSGQPGDAFFSAQDIAVERKRAVALRVLEAIHRLHAQGYVHGDLKGKNILVHDDVPYFLDLDTVRRRWLRVNRTRGVRKDYGRLGETIPVFRDLADWPPDMPS